MNRQQRRTAKGRVNCGRHGLVKWEKHIECSRCHRCYDASKPDLAPVMCECGARLFPEKPTDLIDTFTGRPICPTCHKDRSSKDSLTSGGEVK